MITAAEIRPLSEQVIDEIIARHPDKTGDVLDSPEIFDE